jgi:hypothetical protein
MCQCQLLLKTPLASGKYIAARASVIGNSAEDLARQRRESLINLQKNTNKKKKERKGEDDSRLQQGHRFRLEPDTVARLWTQVPEMAEMAEQCDLAEDRLDLYEVRTAPATKDHHHPPSPSPTASLSRSGTLLHTQVCADGISSIIKDRHCAVTALCPHNHANLSIIPSSTIHYFLPKPRNSAPIHEHTDTSSRTLALPESSSPHDSSPSCRLVEVSRDTSACPNCGDILNPVLMNTEDMKHVQSVLTTLTTGASKVAGQKLKVINTLNDKHLDFLLFI